MCSSVYNNMSHLKSSTGSLRSRSALTSGSLTGAQRDPMVLVMYPASLFRSSAP